jgi:hypothetical protein
VFYLSGGWGRLGSDGMENFWEKPSEYFSITENDDKTNLVGKLGSFALFILLIRRFLEAMGLLEQQKSNGKIH